MTIFTNQNRTKEIGIRKVAGASVSNIFLLLIRDFFITIIVANVISWPISFFVMDIWRQNFAYQKRLTVQPFLISLVFTLVLTLITISKETYKASSADPVEALKYE